MESSDIKNKIDASNSADFGNVFNRSVELFKKTWSQGFLLLIFFILTYFSLGAILVFPFVIISEFNDGINITNNFGFSLFGILCFFMIIIFLLFLMTFFTGLLGGLYVIYEKADKNENYSTSDFFVLLRKNTFVKTFKISTITLGIVLVSYMMCFFPILYTIIPISYIIIVYAFNQNMNTTEVVKIAFAIGNKNWVVTFLLRIVMSFIAYFGLFLCGIGFFFTFAIILIPQYFIYKDATGYKGYDELDKIRGYEQDKI